MRAEHLQLAIPFCLLYGLASLAPAQTFLTIHGLGENQSGLVPTAVPDGDIYGTGVDGFFQLSPKTGGGWKFTDLQVLGGSPAVAAPGGGFYLGGACRPTCQYGAVSLISPPSAPGGSWAQSPIYAFKGTPDGADPIGNLILNGNGSLYGVTGGGGQYGYGTAYQLIPPSAPGGAWTETILYSFAGPPGDGDGPLGLTPGSDGSLYGMTAFGGPGSCGPSGCGVVFQLTPPSALGGAWQESIIYGLQDNGDGYEPNSVALAPGGEMYGTTARGGSALEGTVFALAPPSAPGGAWTKSTLFVFKKAGEGLGPTGLVLGPDGNLYGTAYRGGKKCYRSNTCGTVFELIAPASPGGAWTERTVHVFTGKSGKDGANPSALSVGPDGNFYGTTKQYDATVFEVIP